MNISSIYILYEIIGCNLYQHLYNKDIVFIYLIKVESPG